MKKFRIPRKLKKKIPVGLYCYSYTGKKSEVWSDEFNQFVPVYNVKYCPFYFKNKLENGDCRLLSKDKINGEDFLDLCLIDQCKSCDFRLGKI